DSEGWTAGCGGFARSHSASSSSNGSAEVDGAGSGADGAGVSPTDTSSCFTSSAIVQTSRIETIKFSYGVAKYGIRQTAKMLMMPFNNATVLFIRHCLGYSPNTSAPSRVERSERWKDRADISCVPRGLSIFPLKSAAERLERFSQSFPSFPAERLAERLLSSCVCDGFRCDLSFFPSFTVALTFALIRSKVPGIP